MDFPEDDRSFDAGHGYRGEGSSSFPPQEEDFNRGEGIDVDSIMQRFYKGDGDISFLIEESIVMLPCGTKFTEDAFLMLLIKDYCGEWLMNYDKTEMFSIIYTIKLELFAEFNYQYGLLKEMAEREGLSADEQCLRNMAICMCIATELGFGRKSKLIKAKHD